MKRKADASDPAVANGHSKKQAVDPDAMHARFAAGLFDQATRDNYTSQYAASEPYKHAVVSRLMDDALLRSVRSEITQNIHFTPKETDIYKIHQSGDLANLDGLPASALEKLPSLLKLRDALYSKDFREWISAVSGAGPVSGKKTDMAVNVYVPGCHLLCHDDVIGSRRVSYILYLTDPDKPWKAEWGGALRLYPVNEKKGDDGKTYNVPQAEWSKVIPPAWNQLSFFEVQPGASFHDVEEVYARAEGDSDDDGGRVRMAISGWFHIPQEGEDGYEAGLEEKLAEKSSLQQLQGKADQVDEPQTMWIDPAENAQSTDDEDVEGLSETDLEFLLQYMTPNYLTPDTVEELNELFAEESTLQLANFLSKKFSVSLREWLDQQSQDNNAQSPKLSTSSPPYKHRYQYSHANPSASKSNPYECILNDLLPSIQFRKWLSLATGLTLNRCSILARRFRKSLDYQLAQSYSGEDPQLEYTLNITPTLGWGGDANQDEDDENEETTHSNGNSNGNSKPQPADEDDNVGGYELYMAGDEDDEDDTASHTDLTIPTNIQSQTGAGDRRSSKRKKADPAVYQAATDDEDDGILFSNPASWNTFSVVLRDRGTLKFVKYVSGSAKGDRWDFTGCVEVEDDDDDDIDAEDE
ncbi:Fe II 2-oxoglutarate-dependent dioxygenase like protein [Acrodontium crateriforme]|uniref:uS12 prolyl 3,4-dihydroxylase n=1 Tax=Acrodontium crateriforme TaxID=150365 RepID=A0AAQ3MBZ4_9PEZI|nr:Fe II 2-oxoglutarate-dependent dioxygenase like protein [Acrodontium crateriforme]